MSPMWRRLFKSEPDPRDVRDKLRVDVMGLAIKVGANRVPPELLDEACRIAATQGMKAARAHIAKAG